MIELPGDLPIVERRTVRLIVLDALDQVLLFHTRDPWNTDFGTWWELPGGGIEPGETYLAAGLRELREETGIDAAACQVGQPTWRRSASFRYRDVRRLQHEVVVTVRLNEVGPAIDESGRLDHEIEDYFDFRWWPLAELSGSRERFYPGRLPTLLSPFLNGEEISEPFELWS